MRDPGSLPLAVEGVRLDSVLSVEGEGGQGEGGKNQNWAHGFRLSGFQLTSLRRFHGFHGLSGGLLGAKSLDWLHKCCATSEEPFLRG
jgi:hypothetical protein